MKIIATPVFKRVCVWYFDFYFILFIYFYFC